MPSLTHPETPRSRIALGPVAALIACTSLAAHGCGDGPICPSDIIVVIASAPDGSTITTDVSPDPGIQSDIEVRTSLRAGERVTLTVLDATGTEVNVVDATTDEEGDAVFEAVDMPSGQAILRAEADAGECGAGFDEVQVSVLAGGGCGLDVAEGLLESDFYQSPVLNTTNDSDAQLAGFQAHFTITTSPSYDVELFRIDLATGGEISAAELTADTQGNASTASSITLDEGNQAWLARCYPPGGGLATTSSNLFFYVDTDAPTCSFQTPPEASLIDLDMDTDFSVPGTQLTLIGQVDAGASDDIEGERASFTVDGVPMDGTPIDSDGQSSSATQVTFDTPGTYGLVFQTQDHAGNPCVASQDNVYQAEGTPPQVDLQFVDPVTQCGGAVPPSADVDPAMPGVQIDVRVVSPQVASRWVEVTDDMGNTVTTPAGVGGDTRITITPGLNNIVAVAEDGRMLQGRTGPCDVALLDIVIGFGPPVNDGLVGGSEGLVNGSQVTFDLCGTVSENMATIDVSIDNAPAQPAVVNGMDWCLNGVTLDESTPMAPFHSIEVAASTGTQFGMATRDVVVDLTSGPPVGGLVGVADTRQSIFLSWSAPDDGSGAPASSYTVKIATTPLNDANFDTTGTPVAAPPPSAPGVTQTLVIDQLRAGTDYYVGVAARDAASNRSFAQVVGPITPDFDATGGIPATDPNAGDNSLGYQIASGDFNGDGFSDLAVSAPFKAVDVNNNGVFDADESGVGTVYVYFGGPGGIGNPLDPPDVTIEGMTTGAMTGGQFGNGITALEWNGDSATDLVIGEPFGNNINGRVYVFHGGAGFASNDRASDANLTIGSAGGWFDFGAMGWTLATARFDGDMNDDLVIAVPGGGFGVGGVAVIYGGHGITSGTIRLSELDPVPSNGAKTLVIRDPDPATFDLFGQTLVNLGRLGGAGDLRDDIGVAYPDGDSIYILRGRAQPMAVGVTIADVLPTDLEIQDDSVDTTEVHFGSSLGSLADTNGNASREIIIGAWAEGSNTSGRVLLMDGALTGVQSAASALTIITPSTLPERHFGAAVLNNAIARNGADVDNDGLEDLLVVGGFGDAVTMYVWFGGNIPSGAVGSNTAGHTIAAPIAFDSALSGASGTPIVAEWIGDMNNDGLGDICWADFTANTTDGVFEVLWDDGV